MPTTEICFQGEQQLSKACVENTQETNGVLGGRPLDTAERNSLRLLDLGRGLSSLIVPVALPSHQWRPYIAF